MKVLKFHELINEYNQEEHIDKPIKSFQTQKNLNPVVWKDESSLQDGIKEELMSIATDIYNSLELSFPWSDVILTGSLANYNWSEYSDFDLHILLDFSKVDDNVALVKKYFDNYKSNWNLQHDIKIKGFDIEVYLQDINEPHIASGVFSLLNNKWNVEPKPFDGEVDTELVKKKAEDLMAQIDLLEEEIDSISYEEFKEKAKNVWDKVKKSRAEGLAEGGELGTGNIVFKLLRRNGYIEKIVDMKMQAYDKNHSID